MSLLPLSLISFFTKPDIAERSCYSPDSTDPKASTASDRCRLLELPTELRLHILSMLFEDWRDHVAPNLPSPAMFNEHGVLRLRPDRQPARIIPCWKNRRPSVFLVCKQLRCEARDAMYEKTLFFQSLDPLHDERDVIPCQGTFWDGPVNNLEIHSKIHHTSEVGHVVSQLRYMLDVIPPTRKYTRIRVWLYALTAFQGNEDDASPSDQDVEKAWLGLTKLLELKLGCVVEFTVNKAWQDALGSERTVQLMQNANVTALPRDEHHLTWFR